jgi:HPt (histidine-containing phosphotransfer) domain-containing protein
MSNFDQMPILSVYEGDPIFTDLLVAYCRALPQTIDTLHAALISGDFDVAKRAVHSFKGSSATYGFPQLADIASQLYAEVCKHKLMQPNKFASDQVRAFFCSLAGQTALVTTSSEGGSFQEAFAPNAHIMESIARATNTSEVLR